MSAKITCIYCGIDEDLGITTADVSFTWRGARQDGEREVVCCRFCAEEDDDLLDGWTALEEDGS